ncbi:MAG: UDP-N-acetylmuramate dehydrogenase [Rhodobacteraceae bacterium]|nr:UDP-N-acetylmuramate dehydrogenase [Paracoccaceae bacterium]
MQEKYGGRLICNQQLADLTWLRVGGPAEWLFQPGSLAELQDFLANLPGTVPIFVLGAGSNLIVRDGGLAGVVIRLGKPFTTVSADNQSVTAGAAMRVGRLACMAADRGLDLTFLRTIPGTVGGAVRMNAGCYGTYVSDCLTSATIVDRSGRRQEHPGEALGLGYRSSRIEADSIVISATFHCQTNTVADLHRQMRSYNDRRAANQPTGVRTAGSTFRNPSGRSSSYDRRDRGLRTAWQVIDAAGLRGYRQGDAGVSELHPNFLINHGSATGTQMEDLGEYIRTRVRQSVGVDLVWEVDRVGMRPVAKGEPEPGGAVS